jgi:hypothetical protein
MGTLITDGDEGWQITATQTAVSADISRIHRRFNFGRREGKWRSPFDMVGLEPVSVHNSGVHLGRLGKITRNFNHDNQKSG